MMEFLKHYVRCSRISLLGMFFFLTFMTALGEEKLESKDIGIIAHRGFFTALKDSTQNSLAAFDAAIEAGFYGSETDVWITKDDVLVINHDSTIDNIVIEDNNYSEIKDIKLSNGETLPTLEDFLNLLKIKNCSTKLIIEIKSQSKERSVDAVDKIIEMVSSYGVQEKVEYISFWLDALLRTKEIEPNAICSFLGGSFSPNELSYDDINLDYNHQVFYKNPSWIEEAHSVGLKTNVWTVNSYEQIYDFMKRGVDFVTTNYPDLATNIKNEIEKESIIKELSDVNDESFICYDLKGHKIKKIYKNEPIIRVHKSGKTIKSF